MGDLVERLRYTAEHGIFQAVDMAMYANPEDVLDRIERLEAALREIAEHPGPNASEGAHWRAEMASQALGAPHDQ